MPRFVSCCGSNAPSICKRCKFICCVMLDNRIFYSFSRISRFSIFKFDSISWNSIVWQASRRLCVTSRALCGLCRPLAPHKFFQWNVLFIDRVPSRTLSCQCELRLRHRKMFKFTSLAFTFIIMTFLRESLLSVLVYKSHLLRVCLMKIY